MGSWRTLDPRQILHALSAISEHGVFSPGRPRTLAFRSGAEWSSDLLTAVQSKFKGTLYTLDYYFQLATTDNLYTEFDQNFDTNFCLIYMFEGLLTKRKKSFFKIGLHVCVIVRNMHA